MRRTTTHIIVAALCVAGTYVATASPAAAGNVHMDGFISKKADGPFRGKFIYNETGENQTVAKHAVPGQTRKFYAQFVNRANATSPASLTGTLSAPCFRVKYFDNVSGMPAELDPTINFGSVGPGFETSLLRTEVKAKGCAAPGTKYIVNMDVEPPPINGSFDRVRAKLKVT